jgi:hypothetical protein
MWSKGGRLVLEKIKFDFLFGFLRFVWLLQVVWHERSERASARANFLPLQDIISKRAL